MNRDIVIRRGLAEDCEHFGRLLLLSARSVLPAFGKNASQVIKSLFGHKRNLFSFEHSHFIQVCGTSAGIILGYDGKAQRQEILRTGLLLLKYMKGGLIARLPVLVRVNSVFSNVGADEYYISNIAVYPEFRHLGLATRLLIQAEEEARIAGAKAVVLDVEANNREAINLYTKGGYVTISKPREVVICGRPHTFIRLSKTISSTPLATSSDP